MIQKIELENNFNELIIIDFISKNAMYYKSNSLIKNNQFNITEELINEVKSYITYWDNEYVDNNIIDGSSSKLIIYTNNEIIKYHFKNKYPYNYKNFVKILKELVDVK